VQRDSCFGICVSRLSKRDQKSRSPHPFLVTRNGGPGRRPVTGWALLIFRGLAALLVSVAVAAQQSAPTWEELERKGTRLASVEFHVGDVFDPSRPHEDHWLGRVVNVLHIETRERVIRREVPLRAGDAVNARGIHEIERALRSFRFLKDASIEPRIDEGGAVHAVVRTQDAWTLKASVSFSQVGDQKSLGFTLREANLLGFGKYLTLGHDKEPERSTDTLLYVDRQFLGSDWTLTSRYQALSDGKTRMLDLTRPYRRLDTPWSLSFHLSASDSVETIYNQQRAAYAFGSRRDDLWLGGSWAASVTDSRAIRLGGGLDVKRTRFGNPQVLEAGSLPTAIPPDRNLRGMHISWSLSEDRFRPYRDMASMTHTEDFNLGWEATVAFGGYLKALGSDVNAPFLWASASKGWAPAPATLLLLDTRWEARLEPGGWQDGRVNGTFKAYYQGFPMQTQAALVQVDAVHRPDPQNHLYLGGLDGLRGYGNHLWLGDRRWMISLEERITTQHNLLGILQLGFVVYADAASIRRVDTGQWSRTYLDVGGGFRVGNLKSSFGGVFLLTVAIPLVKDSWTDRYQVVVGDLVRF